MSPKQTFVIAGASLAGAKAAEALRKEGFDGRIVLVGAEPERPYERPPLSKGYLRGESPREKVYVHPERFYAERAIELRTSTVATAIDVVGRELVLDGDERLRFDRLLLTTGAEPRRLAVPGAELDGVLYLRELRDADAIRERIERGGRLAIVGAGWIGAEVAASARERGVEVTVVDPGSVPLGRVLGPEVGAVYRELHRRHGVELLLGSRIERLEGDGSVRRVVTSDGRRVECDAVVVGIGVVPRVELATQAGIATENGILVDERLETGVPGIFAAGDVARARHPLYEDRLRIEHWANALHQGPAVARNILGAGAAYERIPYFFSDQYDASMEYSGHAPRWDRVVFRGDRESPSFMAFWLSGDRVLAGMAMNVWRTTAAVEALIRDRVPVDSARLADPDVPLEEVARPRRPAPRPPVKGLVAQGINFTRRFVVDRLAKGDPTPVSELPAGQAKVLQVGGEKVAVHRDAAGRLHALSPVCTHMGCIVDWNASERTWDCPCHGSRFGIDGKVLRGPAKRELEVRRVAPEAGA